MGSRIPNRLCVYCNQEKPWVFSGKKMKDGSKIYTNEFAVRWSGRRCPDCERHRVQAAVRYDTFERNLILDQLESAGFNILSKTLPLKVEKEGQEFSVGIRHAQVNDGQVSLDKAPKEKSDLQALVFLSVRLCTAEQLEKIEMKGLDKKARKGATTKGQAKPVEQAF